MFAQICTLFASESSTLSMGLVGFAGLAVYGLWSRRRQLVKAVSQVFIVERVVAKPSDATKEHSLAA